MWLVPQTSARHRAVRTVDGRSLRRAEPDVRQTDGGNPERERPRCGTRVLPGVTAAPLGRTAMSLERRRPDSLARTRPPGVTGSDAPRGLRLAHPEVGDGRGERDRTPARTRWAPRTCNRSTVAFSRRTSREAREINLKQFLVKPGGGRGAHWPQGTERTTSWNDTVQFPRSTATATTGWVSAAIVGHPGH